MSVYAKDLEPGMVVILSGGIAHAAVVTAVEDVPRDGVTYVTRTRGSVSLKGVFGRYVSFVSFDADAPAIRDMVSSWSA